MAVTNTPDKSEMKAWRDLAVRAIDCLHDVERETDWGQPTFGPSVYETFRDEMNALSSRPPADQVADMVERDMSGETVLGMRVAAYRETHPEHGNKFGHIYSEHWSTPNYRHPNVKVERLFTEKQVRDLIQQQQATIERLSAALKKAEVAMTCGHRDGACYCPNCDNSFYGPRAEIRAALGKDASDE